VQAKSSVGISVFDKYIFENYYIVRSENRFNDNLEVSYPFKYF